MSEGLQQALVIAILGAAVLYLVDKFTGVSAAYRRKNKPDVPTSRLVRRIDRD